MAGRLQGRPRRPAARDSCPTVSLIVASYNSAETIGATLSSLQRQTLSSIEAIVVDDASRDGSADIVRAFASSDPRVRLIQKDRNAGPAACRNLALLEARGDWIAVVDSDDLIAPNRLERLVAAAQAWDADIVSDNVALFRETPRAPWGTVLPLSLPEEGTWIDLATFVRRSGLEDGFRSLGYLQPMFRRRVIAEQGLVYDETLKIAEDYDFLARLLAKGARMRVFPWPGYLYRQRHRSLSRTLSAADVRAMLKADDEFRRQAAAQDRAVRAALDARRETIVRTLSYLSFVEAVRRRDPAGLAILLRCPEHILKAVRFRIGKRLSGLVGARIRRPGGPMDQGLPG